MPRLYDRALARRVDPRAQSRAQAGIQPAGNRPPGLGVRGARAGAGRGRGTWPPATRSGWCAPRLRSSRSSAAGSAPGSRRTAWETCSTGCVATSERLSLSVDNIVGRAGAGCGHAGARPGARTQVPTADRPMGRPGAARESELGEQRPRLLRQQLRAAPGPGSDDRRRDTRGLSARRAPRGRREGHHAGLPRGEHGALLPAAGGGESGGGERHDRAPADGARSRRSRSPGPFCSPTGGRSPSSRGIGSSRSLERPSEVAGGSRDGAFPGAARRPGRRAGRGPALAAPGRRRTPRGLVDLCSGARAPARLRLLGGGRRSLAARDRLRSTERDGSRRSSPFVDPGRRVCRAALGIRHPRQRLDLPGDRSRTVRPGALPGILVAAQSRLGPAGRWPSGRPCRRPSDRCSR